MELTKEECLSELQSQFEKASNIFECRKAFNFMQSGYDKKLLDVNDIFEAHILYRDEIRTSGLKIKTTPEDTEALQQIGQQMLRLTHSGLK